MNKIISTGLVLGAALSLVGCGGGSDVETGVAYYLDSAVAGVNYKCGSQEGITDEDGKFVFEKGESCTFYLGDIQLKSMDESLLKDGKKIIEDDIKIAALLQSLDIDGNPDNGITITEEVVEVMQSAIEGDGEEAALPDTTEELEALVAAIENNVTDYEGTVVTEEQAAEHLQDTQEEVIKELFAGKTFYVVEEGDDDVETAIFDAAFTQVTVMEDEETFVMDLHLDGEKIYCCDNEYDTIAAVEDDYILVNSYINGVLDEQMRFYTDESKAAEYAESNADSPLKAVLAGKTFYIVSHDGMTKVVFDTDFTTVITTDYDHDGTPESTSDVDDVVTDGDKLIINSDGDYIKFNSDQGEYQLWDLYDSHNTLEEQVRAYADETKAKEYLATLSGGSAVDSTITEEQVRAALIGKSIYRSKSDCDGTIVQNQQIQVGETTMSYYEDGVLKAKDIAFTINGATFGVVDEDEDDGGDFSTVIEITDTYVKIVEDDDDVEIWYYSQTDAQANPEQDDECYVMPTTAEEARAMIVGTWWRECSATTINDEVVYRVKERVINGDGTARFMSHYYSDDACTVASTTVEDTSFSFSYYLGNQTVGSAGETAYEWDTVSDYGSKYWMVRFDDRGIYFTDITDEKDATSPETRADYFYPNSTPYIKE